MAETLLLVDGNNIAIRGWFSGNQFGFWNMVSDVAGEVHADYLITVFDNGLPGWRRELYPAYKAGRSADEDRNRYVRAVSLALSSYCRVYSFPEADDGIGSLAHAATAHPLPVHSVILSSDRDFLQLVSDRVSMVVFRRSFGTRAYLGVRHVRPTPLQLDFMAIVGDTSDNIPGVKGIGPKGAEALLSLFGSLTGIYQNLPAVRRIKPRWADLLYASRGQAALSRVLAEIKTDLPVELSFQDCMWDREVFFSTMAVYRELLEGHAGALQGVSGHFDGA